MEILALLTGVLTSAAHSAHGNLISTRTPRIHNTGSVLAHLITRIVRYDSAVFTENHQTWNSINPKLSHHTFTMPVPKRHGYPWHLAIILVVLILAPVPRSKYDLQFFAVRVDLVVDVSQFWCEPATWRAPVGTEVDRYHFTCVEDLL